MKATYLGLELGSPVVVSSSPYTATLANIEKCAAAGAGAVVLKSIFEEQILHHAAALEHTSDSPYGDAGDYLQRYLGEDYKAGFLQLIADARRATSIPVIASINCVAAGDEWIEYASAMAEAGASALELNIFIQPVDAARSSQELERLYVEIARRVCTAVRIPVSVKLAMRFTNVVAAVAALESVGVRGAVLFNRFFEPDVDVERMTFVEGSPYSEASELRNVLRTTAICAGALPRMDFAVSTGVHDGEAAVKALLCGASAVEVCTAIHRDGFEAVTRMNEWIDAWAARHGVTTLDEIVGRLDFRNCDSEMFQRVQYMTYFPGRE
ncbi:dihydroorotate dehydrogenase-like protein [Alistipes sp.]|uniref:dihydroorotate dehydrogenase-like protein n=1 Tax=Alistipes sp. TaxID=1872444 RepID=UPI003A8951FD